MQAESQILYFASIDKREEERAHLWEDIVLLLKRSDFTRSASECEAQWSSQQHESCCRLADKLKRITSKKIGSMSEDSARYVAEEEDKEGSESESEDEDEEIPNRKSTSIQSMKSGLGSTNNGMLLQTQSATR